ncbi:flavin reductase family protein [Brevibacterium daeguense]|uniref:Flavin reductase family protein n=1 Tax=Brevibacterium daeguense TaxID=909936 RepID=A0ABP8EMG8_9MICO
MAASDPRFVDAYRSLSEDIAAGLAVLSCLRSGRGQAITIDSYLDVSWDPPTMAVSIYGGSRMMESLEFTDSCALSILNQEQKGVAQWLGEPGQPLYGVLDTVSTITSPAGLPVIAGCLAFFDLRIVDRVEVATHVLVVGEVTACGSETFDSPDSRTDSGRRMPLVRWAEQYGTFTSRGA